MSLYLEKKFVSLVSPKLTNFKQKDDYLWNFRCPFCGDSKKNKLKSRGYFFRKTSNLFFMCHNCAASMRFSTFLKEMDEPLYQQFQMETFADRIPIPKQNTSEPTLAKTNIFGKKDIALPALSRLPEGNLARGYAETRRLPKQFWSDLYYARDFKGFVKEFHPEYKKADRLVENEPRLIIPFRDENGKILGLQGRALGTSKIKYITIKLHDDNVKIFGMDRVNKKERIYVLEGPFDSMFIPNAIATMDVSLERVIKDFGDYEYVFVVDNQPRNPEIISAVRKLVNLGKNVVIWPNNIEEKDINEMIMAGMSKVQVLQMIDSNTFSNLRASLELERWRKI